MKKTRIWVLALILVLCGGWIARQVVLRRASLLDGTYIATTGGERDKTPLVVSRRNEVDVRAVLRLESLSSDPQEGLGSCLVFQSSVTAEKVREMAGICVEQGVWPGDGESEPVFKLFLSRVEGGVSRLQSMTWGSEGLTLYAKDSGWPGFDDPEPVIVLGHDGVVRAKDFVALP